MVVVSGDVVGQKLGHFRIVEKLGEGGMGVVYKAVDEKLERTVAIKLLPPTLSNDVGRRTRLLREARSAAAATHANIAALHEVGEAGGRVFLVMEYVEGHTLRRVLSEEPLPLGEALRIARGIARGLARAHERGIVHRDLKPDNVMIDVDGEPKILDFGLAKLREQAEAIAGPSRAELENQATAAVVTLEGQVVGSPGYMSPEQARGKGVDHRTDLFSFGVILYELVTSRRPFVGDTTLEIMIAATRDAHVPASRLNPGVTPELEAVIDRCLAKDPVDRFPDARELVKALESIATSQTQRTPGASLPAPDRGRRARLGRIGAATGLGLAAAVVGFVALRGSNGTTGGGGATSEAGAPASTAIVTVTDEDVPATLGPEAKGEYSAGLQALRDDAWGRAADHFRRAVALDPGVAAPHLRLAMTLETTTSQAEDKRAELGKAVALRSQLNARDAALLEALEPVLGRVHPEPAEAVTKLRAASARFPLDVELLDWLGSLGAPSARLDASRRATELDPKDGQAWENLAKAEAIEGDGEGARRALEQCTTVAVDASDCLIWTANLDAAEGRCADMERTARRLSDLDPQNGPRSLAAATASLGGSPETIAELLDQHVAHVSNNIRPFQRALADAALAVHAGRFLAARVSLSDLSGILAASSNTALPRHLLVASWSTELAQEVGDYAVARAQAQDWVARSGTWATTGAPAFGLDVSMAVSRVGLEDPAAADAARAAWLADPSRRDAPPQIVWALGWALPAQTRADAVAAIAASSGLPSPPALHPSQAIVGMIPGVPEAGVGHAYLLAGRPADALPWLKSAAAACNDLFQPFLHARAVLELAQALDQSGDRAGACAAYATLVTKWGDAKPKSVTASAARAGRAALGCKL